LNHVIKQQGVSCISNSKDWILNSARFESSLHYTMHWLEVVVVFIIPSAVLLNTQIRLNKLREKLATLKYYTI